MHYAGARLVTIALALLAVALLSLGIMLGFFGRQAAPLDTLAHFRLHLAALIAAPAILLVVVARGRERRVGLLALLFGAAATVATVGTPLGNAVTQSAAIAGDLPRYRLLQANLRYDNEDGEALFSLIDRERPDIVTLEEVSPLWAERLSARAADYPYSIVCRRGIRIGGAAILSRHPFVGEPPRCADRGSMARATVDLDGAIVEIAALHMGWPWPYEDRRQLPALMPELATLGQRAILAGDFNAAWWSARVRSVADAAGIALAGRAGPTWLHRRAPDWLRPLAGLPIDHVLIKGDIAPVVLRRGGNIGSDHLPVILDFAIEPDGAGGVVSAALAG